MRADEHEGDLNDPEARGKADRFNKRARDLLRPAVLDLTESESFIRYISKFVIPATMQNFPSGSGSALERFMGRREVVLQVVEDMEMESPGFMRRVLEIRERDLLDCASYAQKEK